MAPINFSRGLFVLAAFKLVGVQSWPSWFPMPFVSAPVSNDNKLSEPDGLLLRQLDAVDTSREPERALSLHTAVASMLRAEGAPMGDAIQHLAAAYDAALRSADADSILSTRHQLAEAFIEAGRPKDADRVLESEPRTNSLLSPENFWEFSVKLDIARGRTFFEMGDIQLAVETYEEPARITNEPEHKVRLACEMAKAHACLGHAQRSLEPLRNALDVLAKARKADIFTVGEHRSLAMEVHTRLAEALHSLGDTTSAKKQYEMALSSQPRTKGSATRGSSPLKTSIRNLENGEGPTLRCPGGGALTQRFQLPARSDGGKAFKAKISSLLEAHEYRKAEYELWNQLETQGRPYKSRDASTTLTSLGNLYLVPEKKSYFKAAQCFLKALPAALSCCGAQSKEAKAAYQGLSFVQDVIPAKDQSKSFAAMQEYLDAVEHSALPNDLGESIRGLQLV